MRVIHYMYENDVMFEHTLQQNQKPYSEKEFEDVLDLPNEEMLKETGLSKEQVILEVKYLEDEGLVDYFQPFREHEYIIYRLTDEGFQVAHDIHRTEKEETWRKENKQLNFILTVATVLLTLTAVVQAYVAFTNTQSVNEMELSAILMVTLAVAFILIVGRRGTRGPDLWG